MNKAAYKIFLVLIALIIVASCEKDDICIDPTTPHLIIRFYDSNNTSNTKTVEQLMVAVENSLSETIQIGITKTTDSIVIPLNVDLDSTKITLSKNANGTNDIIDNFTLNYIRKEVFVSRSCGYKILYEDIQTENITNNWMENITINNSNIENETAAHLSIFH